MDVFASRQDKGVPDGVTPRAWLNITPLQCLLQSTQLIILDDLLKAELQILEDIPQLVLVGLLELSALHRASNTCSFNACSKAPSLLSLTTCARQDSRYWSTFRSSSLLDFLNSVPYIERVTHVCYKTNAT